MTDFLRRLSAFVLTTAVPTVMLLGITGHAVAQNPPPAAAPSRADVVATFLREYEAAPRMTVPVISGGAAVVIVKFTDYQCPACAATHRLYKPVLEKYEREFPGDVKVIIKNFPLDQRCNSTLAQTMHPAACPAAAAVTLARAQKSEGPLEDWLYANQQALTPESVRSAAAQFGNVKDFDGNYARALEQVKADAGLGGLLGVNSTPTFFINGVKIAQVLQPELFDAAIAFELRKAGKMK